MGWLGLNAHHNIDFRAGPFGAAGFVMYNGGEFKSNATTTELQRSISVNGLAANLELLWNWGRTTNDVVSLEGMMSTGDSNPNDGKYTSAFTMNYYGLPGAVWFNHRTFILFPFTSTVNNYTGAVTDISNQGYGLRAAIATAAVDLVPNKLNLRVGAAHAQSAVTPVTFADSTKGRGRVIGTEVNAQLVLQIRFLMNVGLHAAYMFKGDFYDGETSRVKQNPVALFTTFTWYAF